MLQRPPPPRSHYAAGEYLTRYPAGSQYALRLDSPRPKPGWEARREGTPVLVVHAGTPVFFEGRTFEVVRSERSPRGDRFVYLLAPWDESKPLRTPIELSPESCEREAAEHRLRQQQSAIARLLRLLAPLVALLPARDQRALERELDFPASAATAISAAILLSASAGVVFSALAQSLASGTLPGLGWTTSVAPWAVYFAAESLVRFLSAIRLDEPMGSFPVWLPAETVRAVRHELALENRQARRRERQKRARADDAMAGARDQVRQVATANGGEELEVTSLLPKPHWTIDKTAIYVGDACHYLAGREIHDTPDGPRYLFRLRRPEEEMHFREVAHYDPTEMQTLYAEERRLDRSAWVETLAPLFGYLDPSIQARLAERYEYDVERATRSSIVIGIVVGLTATVVPLRYLTSLGLVDVLVLAAGIALLAESIVRARRFVAGEMRGAVLGKLLRPLGEKLVR